MTMPSAGRIYGDLEQIANNAQGIQELADIESNLMQQLANTLDGLASSLPPTSSTGKAIQLAGQQIHTAGMQFSTQFADQSQKMGNNAALLSNQDETNAAHIAAQLENLT